MVHISDALSERVLVASSWAMIGVGAVTLLALLLITAPYGRFTKAQGWGPLIPAYIAWMVMESPNLWMPIAVFRLKENKADSIESLLTPNLVLLVAFYLHYIHRSLIFPLTMPSTKPMPLAVLLAAFCYCCWNSFNQSLSLLVVNEYPRDWLHSPQFLIGGILFVVGMAMNVSSDHQLLILKRRGASKGQDYIIPTGGLFELVSCPNYLGEVVEWIGFALASNSIAGTAFAWYTFCNLVPRALSSHKWYQQKFEDYPKDRKAVIPFVL